MLWLLIIITIAFVPLLYLLIAPFYLEINTSKGWFCFRLHRLASVQLIADERGFMIHLKILWWYKIVDPLRLGKHKTISDKAKMPPERKAGKKRGAGIHTRKLWGVLRSFQVPVCYIDIDTGNMALNGILYPWVWVLGHKVGRDVSINFEGRTDIELIVKNRMSRMLWAYIKS